MEENLNYFEKAPEGYSLCFQSQCASAAKCLRALAARDINKSVPKLTIVNPLSVNTTSEGECPSFKSVDKARIARGFTNALRLIPMGNVENVRKTITEQLNQRDYYYLRSGEKQMNPKMQEQIAAILTANGAPEPIEFDRYEEGIVWE